MAKYTRQILHTSRITHIAAKFCATQITQRKIYATRHTQEGNFGNATNRNSTTTSDSMMPHRVNTLADLFTTSEAFLSVLTMAPKRKKKKKLRAICFQSWAAKYEQSSKKKEPRREGRTSINSQPSIRYTERQRFPCLSRPFLVTLPPPPLKACLRMPSN